MNTEPELARRGDRNACRATRLGAWVVFWCLGASSATADLLVYYSFDDGSVSGNVVFDDSLNGHSGILTAASGGAGGKFGQAVDFSGTRGTSELKAMFSGEPAFGSSFSVSFWVLADDTRSSYLLHRGTQYNDQNSIVSNFTGPGVHLFGAGTGVWDASAMSLDSVGRWTNVIYSYDGSTLRGYVDGSQMVNVAIGVSWASTGDLYLGSSNNSMGYGDNYAGLMDDFAIWDDAISSLTVAQLQVSPISALIAVPEIDPAAIAGVVALLVSAAGMVDQHRRHRAPRTVDARPSAR